jgi:hypothetical protein
MSKIKGIYNLMPVIVKWKDEQEVKEAMVFLDLYNEKVYNPVGATIPEEEILEIVREKKKNMSPVVPSNVATAYQRRGEKVPYAKGNIPNV